MAELLGDPRSPCTARLSAGTVTWLRPLACRCPVQGTEATTAFRHQTREAGEERPTLTKTLYLTFKLPASCLDSQLRASQHTFTCLSWRGPPWTTHLPEQLAFPFSPLPTHPVFNPSLKPFNCTCLKTPKSLHFSPSHSRHP